MRKRKIKEPNNIELEELLKQDSRESAPDEAEIDEMAKCYAKEQVDESKLPF